MLINEDMGVQSCDICQIKDKKNFVRKVNFDLIYLEKYVSKTNYFN
jgi:hypothetical protein